MRRHELQKLPWLISNSFRGPGFLVLTSAGVWGEYPDHLALSLFISGGRMGFSITAAAVTVTVATSDMLRFCKMKFLQMSIHRSPCKHYLRRKTTFFFFFYPHWTQRIPTRFSSSTKWENYLKGLNITSQKRETEKKKSIFFEIHFAFSTVLWRSLQGSDHRTWIMDLSFDVVQYIQKAGKWLQPGLCQLCWSVDNMRKSPPFCCLLVLFPDCTRIRF